MFPTKIKVGVSLMLNPEFEQILSNVNPEALEWSMDQAWSPNFDSRFILPDTIQTILNKFSQTNSLWGHGVHLSPGSPFDLNQQNWLSRFAEETQEFKFQAITEHFGFMRTKFMSRGAPLPLPPSSTSVETICQSLMQMKSRSNNNKIGLENLALALSAQDVWSQAKLISEILSKIDGCLVMDLHNLYCQCYNYNIDWRLLIAEYPLDRVEIIHVSGGSTEQHGDRTFRRDTHDGPIPEQVFDMLTESLGLFPNLKVVFFEHLGHELTKPDQINTHYLDYQRVFGIVDQFRKNPVKLRLEKVQPNPVFNQINLEQYQIELINELIGQQPIPKIKKNLIQKFPELQSYLESFDPLALEITRKICLKWAQFK